MPTDKTKIKFDKKNYRKHSDKNKRIIEKSLKELGAGRSILIDSENEIIGGNGVFEQAEKLNIPTRIIETDGKELIAIKRTDLKTSDKKRKELALIDNHASDTSEFDMDLIKEDFKDVKLEEWEFEKTESRFSKTFSNNETFDEALIEFPITIITNKMEFDEWQKLKEKYNTKDDTKLFFKIATKEYKK